MADMNEQELLTRLNKLGELDHLNYPSGELILLRRELTHLKRIEEAATHAVKARREYLAALNSDERSTAAEDYVHAKANQWAIAWAKLVQACYPRK